MIGTANVSLKEKDIASVVISLPPLDEQRRIVARIEGLAGKIEGAKGLQRRIIDEADAVLKTRLNSIFGNPYVGEKGEVGDVQIVRLDDVISDVADGPHITPHYVEDGVPFITVLNITSGRIQFANHKFVTREDHLLFQQRAKAEKGDVLISKDGTLGVPCIVDTDKDFSFFVSVALIKPIREKLDGEYLCWAIRSLYLQARIQERSRGDMIRHLVLREIRDLQIPLPSLAEQVRIVRYMEGLRMRCEEVKMLNLERLSILEALMPSILDSAFKGEL
jgi:type I restriction enzyme S subunit